MPHKQSNPTLGEALSSLDTTGLFDHGYSSRSRINFLSLPLLAYGGEGWILDADSLRKGEVLKLFFPPEMSRLPEESAAKWDQYPKKLPELAKLKFPSAVVEPKQLITEKNLKGSRVLGYFMDRVKGFELAELTVQLGREERKFDRNAIVRLFTKIYDLTDQLHHMGIIIGDNQPQNYLVAGSSPRLIDIESVGFGDYECRGYTEPYVDPTICHSDRDFPEKKLSHTQMTDWYAYEVMLFECLMGIHPYGGAYNGSIDISEDALSLNGISVFNPQVSVPEFIDRLEVLHQKLYQKFLATFEEFERKKFDYDLLSMFWKVCEPCGLEHSRTSCPSCEPEVKSESSWQAPQIALAGKSKKAAVVQRLPSSGAPVYLGVNGQNPVILEAGVSEGKIVLFRNKKPVLNELNPEDSLAAPPAGNLLLLNSKGKILVKSMEGNAPNRNRIQNVKSGLNGPLITTFESSVVYLRDDHELVVGKIDDDLKSASSYKDCTVDSPRFISLGRKLCALASDRALCVLRAGINKIDYVKLKVSEGYKITSLEVHPSLPLVMVNRAGDAGSYSMKTYDSQGEVVLELESSKETYWWFAGEKTDNSASIIYWQDGKLCEAEMDSGKRLQRKWGIEGIKAPVNGYRPHVLGEKLYYVEDEEVRRILLT